MTRVWCWEKLQPHFFALEVGGRTSYGSIDVNMVVAL